MHRRRRVIVWRPNGVRKWIDWSSGVGSCGGGIDGWGRRCSGIDDIISLDVHLRNRQYRGIRRHRSVYDGRRIGSF